MEWLKNKKTIFSTRKEILQDTLKIAGPSMMESLMISLIGAIDTIMVASISTAAVAAVGVTNQPKFILSTLVMSMNIGITVVVSRRKGEQRQKDAYATFRSGLTLSLIIGIVMGIIGIVFASPILTLAGASSDYLYMATPFFQIVMFGMIFQSISMTINAAQRGIGNTKISMRTNVTANIINLVFNYVLINGIWFFPELGVTGAAIATAMGSFVAFLMSVYSITRTDNYLYTNLKKDWKIKKAAIIDFLPIASSAFSEQLFMRIGFFLYAMSVAKLGTIAFATHQICMNIISISFSIGDGLSVANSSLVGQSLGKKDPKLANEYSKATQKIGMLASAILTFILLIFRDQIMSLFTNDPQIIELGGEIMYFIVITIIFQITQVITAGGLRGAGDVKFTAILTLLSVTIIRPILTIFLCFTLELGLIGAWFSLFLDQFIRFLATRMRFKTGKWMKIKV